MAHFREQQAEVMLREPSRRKASEGAGRSLRFQLIMCIINKGTFDACMCVRACLCVTLSYVVQASLEFPMQPKLIMNSCCYLDMLG